jgi:dihydroorotase
MTMTSFVLEHATHKHSVAAIEQIDTQVDKQLPGVHCLFNM